LLGARQGLEPLGDLLEALGAGRLGEAGVHLGVLVGFAGHGRGQVLVGRPDGLVGGRIARLLEEVEVAVCVAGLAIGGVAEEAGDVGIAFHVGVLGEVKIAAIGLGLAGEGGLEVVVGLGARQLLAHLLVPPRIVAPFATVARWR